jgi:serine/threonine-protein kinase
MRQSDSPTQYVSKIVPASETGVLRGRIGEFRIVRLLGRGGMGEVYLARQPSLDRQVALKVLQRGLSAIPESVRRFQVEARACACFSHPNIVQVYAVGEADGRPYIALEYVEGSSLAEHVTRTGPLSVPAALKVIRQVAAALNEAGERGIIHRDIKPENILLTRKGEAKVSDFGLARCRPEENDDSRLTESGVVIGTPLYMSPEQVQGKTIDPRSDIYSFGVTCFCMLAGKPPYNGQTPFDVALQHVQGKPASLADVRNDVPADLCAVVAKMMARNPAERYQSGREIIEDLQRRFGKKLTPASESSFPVLPARAMEPRRKSARQKTRVRTETALTADRVKPGRSRWPMRIGVAIIGLAVSAAFAAYRHKPATEAPTVPVVEPVAEIPVQEAPAQTVFEPPPPPAADPAPQDSGASAASFTIDKDATDKPPPLGTDSKPDSKPTPASDSTSKKPKPTVLTNKPGKPSPLLQIRPQPVRKHPKQ